VVTVGVTLTVPPDNEPGIHVYEVAPEEDKVTVLPAQIVDEDAEAVTVGFGLTVNVKVALLRQPNAFAPTTV
jgi:hypothetical protein